jgi:hypothetical protein
MAKLSISQAPKFHSLVERLVVYQPVAVLPLLKVISWSIHVVSAMAVTAVPEQQPQDNHRSDPPHGGLLLSLEALAPLSHFVLFRASGYGRGSSTPYRGRRFPLFWCKRATTVQDSWCVLPSIWESGWDWKAASPRFSLCLQLNFSTSPFGHETARRDAGAYFLVRETWLFQNGNPAPEVNRNGKSLGSRRLQ